MTERENLSGDAPEGSSVVPQREGDAFSNAFLRPTKYLIFDQAPNPGRKTGCWNVNSVSGNRLGTIRWYGPWRQYCFYPETNTIFNIDCLIGIADRLATCNRWQRNILANREAVEAAKESPAVRPFSATATAQRSPPKNYSDSRPAGGETQR